ncbi:MAG: RtcB family protein [Nanoarchaeota archaeon]|nr:RtcB family protein [Nanoarchaeota archaeon]
MEIKKIKENVYEIKKEAGMKVPVRVYASEKMLEDLKKDKSLQQGMNAAHMPEMQKYFAMMPDAHQGYGFPIGGVAAFDMDNGCISPGGTGYDINCLSGDSKIMFEHGYYKDISEIGQEWKKPSLKCMNFDENKEINTNIQRYIKIKPRNKVYKIKTFTGKEVIATEDHPIWTPSGMILTKKINKDSYLATYPFEGVRYKECSGNTIVKEENILNLDLPIRKDLHIKELKKRNLLNLKKSSDKIAYLIKIIAFNMGDGSLYLCNNNSCTAFWGRKEDLELIREDIKKLGYNPSKVASRQRNHKIKTKRGYAEFTNTEYSIRVQAKSFATLLYALGTPLGKKVAQSYEIPKWILTGPLWHKRLFLACLFGAEMNLPATLTGHGYNFNMPCLSVNKDKANIEGGRKFLLQIMEMLKEFDINSTLGNEKEDYITKNGDMHYRFKLFISNKTENLLKLYKKINFEYNIEKRKIANIAINYLLLKKEVIKERDEAQILAKLLHVNGKSSTQVYQELDYYNINQRYVERSIYSSRKTSPRVPNNFPTFNQFKEGAAKDLGDSGMVWDKVKEIEEVDFKNYVYDFTVKNEHHNFIANNLIVSNCGIRLLTSSLEKEEAADKIKDLLDALFKHVPCGVGSESGLRLTDTQMEDVLNTGVDWAIKNNYALKEDAEHCEEEGHMQTSDASKISQKAKSRGRKQLGTLGAGNHFLEVQYVDKIFNKEVAEKFGITHEGQVTLMIHCGSRGLGHQVCSDYLRKIEKEFPNLVDALPERELAYAPANTQTAKDYLGAMSAAANYAWTNRQLIQYHSKLAFNEIFKDRHNLKLLYDVAHNIVKIEEHEVDGKKKRLLVHRKGATRAFGPGHKEIPIDYREVGQPILLPGSMGTSSYVLVGSEKAMNETFGSTAHGAGRVMSRHEAKKRFRAEEVKKELELQNIYVKSASWKGISEEAPMVYKDVDEVVKVSDNVGIGKIVARLKPIGVIKG